MGELQHPRAALLMPLLRLNNHDMYFEVLGKGDPVLCMGGWGTYCHGNHGNLARGLTDKYQVIIFDYRGIGDSGDDPTLPATIELHANDAIALLAGFWTPIGGVLQALVEFANVLAGAGYEHVVRALIGLSVAMLGPGAWSVDARLFGRKRIDVTVLKD